ncbi:MULTISPECIES: hypothetical protein [unclassified Kitasatospora]|uniref:hypothetical protein n=1 Tax=unclassified Kitasatospora TaxID=2633591 RepID=UPI000AF3C24E|nr:MULTISPECIES: hypothetical protein [unclassified Kitasatospora]
MYAVTTAPVGIDLHAPGRPGSPTSSRWSSGLRADGASPGHRLRNLKERAERGA